MYDARDFTLLFRFYRHAVAAVTHGDKLVLKCLRIFTDQALEDLTDAALRIADLPADVIKFIARSIVHLVFAVNGHRDLFFEVIERHKLADITEQQMILRICPQPVDRHFRQSLYRTKELRDIEQMLHRECRTGIRKTDRVTDIVYAAKRQRAFFNVVLLRVFGLLLPLRNQRKIRGRN